MRNVRFFSIFRNGILLVAIFLFIQSCDKKDVEGENCLTAINTDTLRFNVIDNTTSENLFFSSSPRYSVDQIYVLVDDMPTKVKPYVRTSATLGQHFMVGHSGTDGGRIRIYIADNLEFNIDFTKKIDRSSGCPQYFFDKVVINGTQQEENIQNRVITLRK